MKKKSLFVVMHYLLILMMFSAFVACASTRKQESVGEYVDNSVITAKVKALLAEDEFLKLFQVSVVTFKDTVQLSGFVDSQAAVDRAGKIARSVDGVTAVKNDLIVK